MKEYRQEQEYFQRSLIEEQYGKALVKLAKSATGREEISAVRPAWEKVVLKLSQNCLKVVSKLSKSCLKVVSKLSLSCLKVVSKFS